MNIAPFPIYPQTGGVPITKHIVGREELIEQLWSILERQGISLFAERRFGKSCVLRKMQSDNPKGFRTIYNSVQSIKTPDDFVESLYQKSKDSGIISQKVGDTITSFWNSISNRIEEVKGIKLKSYSNVWQKKMVYLIQNLIESNPHHTIVIFLDEFSIMLDEMSTDDASQVIGFLRDIVHDTFPRDLRFVYTGSIGIDLIIDKIKKAGHSIGDPLNHMERKRLPPLDEEQAKFFCDCLALGCELEISDDLKKYIYNSVDRIPIYIDRIFSIVQSKIEINTENIDRAIIEIIDDKDDSTDLDHFYDRIQDYYPHVDLSYSILNYLCVQNEMIVEDTILDYLNNEIPVKKNLLNDELRRLRADGYLKRKVINGERHYTFEYKIIRQWWKLNKA